MIPRSLNARMLLSVSVLLVLFFGIAAVALDYLFRDASVRAIEDLLEAESLVLMAAAEEQDGLLLPVKEQLDVRFLTPNSGLFGEITTSAGKDLWRSVSLLSNKLGAAGNVRPGQSRLRSRQLANGTHVLVLSVGYAWEFSDRQSQDLVFSVAESEEPYFKQLSHFRWQLFDGFAIMGVLLVVSLLLLLRTVLHPLRKVESEIRMIESGAAQVLSDNYPRELAGVASNMNTLLHHERERMTRYRNTLGNLAHSLKTPLAVIRNMLSAPAQLDTNKLDEQLTLIDDMVRYQLKRAAASAGASIGAAPVALLDVVTPLSEILTKVYVDKKMDCVLDIKPEYKLPCDKNDLMEIVGNLMDNAFKYGLQKVRVSSLKDTAVSVTIIVENDGKSIPSAQYENVLQRGTRLDEQQSGQGIGLSVVNELVLLYGGSIQIGQSALGGARIAVSLPSA